MEKWIETDEGIKLSDMFELPVDKPEIEVEGEQQLKLVNIIIKKVKTERAIFP